MEKNYLPPSEISLPPFPFDYMLSPRVPGNSSFAEFHQPYFYLSCTTQVATDHQLRREADRPAEHVWRFIVARISGKWSTAEKAKRHIFLCLFNKLLIMAGASGLREGVCFPPVVVDVIECSCRAFLHGSLCLGKVQC